MRTRARTRRANAIPRPTLSVAASTSTDFTLLHVNTDPRFYLLDHPPHSFTNHLLGKRLPIISLIPPFALLAHASTHTAKMSVVSLLGVEVKNNPAQFDAPYEFEITFECLEQLQKGTFEWRLVQL